MTDEASQFSVHTSAAAALGSPPPGSSQDAISDSEAEPLPLDLIKREKKKAPTPSKPKRLFGLTTLAALRQRPQLALRQKEAKRSIVKAEQLTRSSPPRAPAVSDDTAGPSNAPLDLPVGHADPAPESPSAGPLPALASVPREWKRAHSPGAHQEGHSMPPDGNSAGLAPVTDEATSFTFPPLPQPKLDQELRLQTGSHAAVNDDLGGLSASEAAGPASTAADSAPHDGAAATDLGIAQVTPRTQRQQAQQGVPSQQPLQSPDPDSAWGLVSPRSYAPPDAMADASFPPLSHAVQRRPNPMVQPALRLAAETAGAIRHADAAEFSLGSFAVPMVAGARELNADPPQGASVWPSRQAQGAEPQADSPNRGDADTAPPGADTSLLASSSAAAVTAPPAGTPAAGVPLVFGQRVAGRGPFRLSNELQQALSGKPKPGRGRDKPAVPLPEPSADLVLQRALMEKPKPRPRPRRPPVTPQSTGMFSCHCIHCAFCPVLSKAAPTLFLCLHWHASLCAGQRRASFS